MGPESAQLTGVPFTTVSINKNYAAARHRDGNNVGPSVGAAVGQFEGGGRLLYWPKDDGKLPLEKLRQEDCVALDLRAGAAVFNGNRAHEVERFQHEHERYSVIGFTCAKYVRASQAEREKLEAAGCLWPTLASLASLSQHDVGGKTNTTLLGKPTTHIAAFLDGKQK